jgi:hypothetical protein
MSSPYNDITQKKSAYIINTDECTEIFLDVYSDAVDANSILITITSNKGVITTISSESHPEQFRFTSTIWYSVLLLCFDDKQTYTVKVEYNELASNTAIQQSISISSSW